MRNGVENGVPVIGFSVSFSLWLGYGLNVKDIFLAGSVFP
jgi:hypothetical protein